MEINPWLIYCSENFFCATAWVWYMSFILSIDFCTFLPKNNTANHRSFQLFSVIYVLYIINEFLLPFYKKIIPRIIAVANAFYVVYVLYIINTFIAHFSIKIIPRIIAVTTLFSGICPYIINRFLGKLFDIATFLMLMHTYSLIPLSMQIRASLSDENSV